MISRKNNSDETDFAAGEVILIDKEVGLTSFRVVSVIRRNIGVKKVGHAGTLDPAATGLLIVCSGKKTKEISVYQESRKVYTGIIELGKRTPSFDRETEAIEEKDYSCVSEAMAEEARLKLSGDIKQVPPMYSALKHKGKQLYKYARKGVEIERQPREVSIYRFEITKFELPFVHFEIECSKGTYIRVIADDFGKIVGCGGYLKELRRTAIGEYRVEDAYTLAEFKEKYSVLDEN